MRPQLTRLWRHQEFLKLWGAQTASIFGTQLASFSQAEITNEGRINTKPHLLSKQNVQLVPSIRDLNQRCASDDDLLLGNVLSAERFIKRTEGIVSQHPDLHGGHAVLHQTSGVRIPLILAEDSREGSHFL